MAPSSLPFPLLALAVSDMTQRYFISLDFDIENTEGVCIHGRWQLLTHVVCAPSDPPLHGDDTGPLYTVPMGN